MRRLNIDRMREVAERVTILGDLGGRGDVEPECDALLIRRVDWSEPHVIMRMGGRLFIDVSSGVFDAESHAFRQLETIAVHRRMLNDTYAQALPALSRAGLIML